MYRSVLYLNLKLKIFYLDLTFSDFWLESMFYEKGSVEVVSFFSGLYNVIIICLINNVHASTYSTI